MNNARVAASIDVPDSKIWEPIASLRGFLSATKAGLRRHAAEGTPFEIKGVGDNILELFGGLDLKPTEMDDIVVSELVRSIGNMAKEMGDKHPDQYNQGDLRKASLQFTCFNQSILIIPSTSPYGVEDTPSVTLTATRPRLGFLPRC
ncbi:hypothetical protein FRC06_002160 [Ceratobasidium sp. 370]|nr:hypothetical protein FRC06_002160 [Ceratobasidium sp. 370]